MRAPAAVSPPISKRKCRNSSGELMLWQFPLWWFGLPAVFKGWVDRVFAMGRTYGGDRRFETGVFRDKQALLSVTTGGPAEVSVAGYTARSWTCCAPCTGGCGSRASTYSPHMWSTPQGSRLDRRQEVLEAYRQRLQRLPLEHPIDMGES